jgi:hypothetical protein
MSYTKPTILYESKATTEIMATHRKEDPAYFEIPPPIREVLPAYQADE